MADRPREAGILVPLFALRSARDWGIGEIGDLPPLCAWLVATGHKRLQLLPIFEIAPGERSPYAALSAFAIDPIYLSMVDVEDFVGAGGEGALSPSDRDHLADVRAGRDIAYDRVRALKRVALEIAFTHFRATELTTDSARAHAFERFRSEENAWLAEYSLFRACKETWGEQAWAAWAPELRDHEPAAVAEAERRHADQRLFHEYVQWVASVQWQAARRSAQGIALDGDLPFMVGADSADVWARQDEFRLDATVGAPPDAFNTEGQDWGLPVYRWDAMEVHDFPWMRGRIRRAAALFDAVRLDHVLGFYRMFVRPRENEPAYEPAEDAAQRALGERLLGIMRATAGPMRLVGEDLGNVPDFVRDSLAALGIPGYRVLRWEDEAGIFRDPRRYPAVSVATSGTHDTSTMAVWWEEELSDASRRALARVPGFRALRGATHVFTPAVHQTLLDGLYGARSELVVLPVQDAYGGRERINLPATVGPPNWSYRLPWTLEELAGSSGSGLRDRLATLARRHGRAR